VQNKYLIARKEVQTGKFRSWMPTILLKRKPHEAGWPYPIWYTTD